MMETVVVYKSKTGFTNKYANWLSEALNCDLVEVSKAEINRIAHYDTVIYGGGLYMVGINGINFLRSNMDKLKASNIIVFVTGATPDREEVIEEVVNANFTVEQKKQIKTFYLRGGFNFDEMRVGDKILISLLKVKIKMKKNPSADERGIVAAITHPVDFTKKSNIEKIVGYVNSLDTTDNIEIK
jgi:menaquinone-dependent protoporphyrinogen IX oxidase